MPLASLLLHSFWAALLSFLPLHCSSSSPTFLNLLAPIWIPNQNWSNLPTWWTTTQMGHSPKTNLICVYAQPSGWPLFATHQASKTTHSISGHQRGDPPIWQSKSIMWTPHDVMSYFKFQCIMSVLKLDWGSELRYFTFMMNDESMLLWTVKWLNVAGATNPTKGSKRERR